MAQGDSSKATAQGPGVEPSGNIANKATYFDVYTAGNEGILCASIIQSETGGWEELFNIILWIFNGSQRFLAGAGVGEVEVVIMDPAGKKNTVPCTIEDKGNSSYRCTYKPTQEGQHTLFITFAGGQISKSPFTVNVGEGMNYTGKPC